MRERPLPFDVEGPVRAEVFVVVLDSSGTPLLTGPCGAAPWFIEAGGDEHPMTTVDRLAAANLGVVHVAHSTSWRHEGGSVVLSFVVVSDIEATSAFQHAPVRRAELARGGATSAPVQIDWAQVLEHGLRHLCWLLGDDEHVRQSLPQGWPRVLADYVPEPFRMLP